jgi:hypothetical protein
VRDYQFKRENYFNISTKNKGWRYKEAQKRKKFKGKFTNRIKDIYLERSEIRTNYNLNLITNKSRNKLLRNTTEKKLQKEVIYRRRSYIKNKE